MTDINHEERITALEENGGGGPNANGTQTKKNASN